MFGWQHFKLRSKYPTVPPPCDGHFIKAYFFAATPISFNSCGAGITSCMIQRM